MGTRIQIRRRIRFGYSMKSLTRQLSLVFAVMLLACSGVSMWLQFSYNARHEQELVQRLSAGLAQHIANTSQLMDASGWRPAAVRELFDELMAVNPSVEVYLLSNTGKVVGSAVPQGQLKLETVDLAPVHELLAGNALPIVDDDPRQLGVRKVFSVATVVVGGQAAGFVYVILQGKAFETLADCLAADSMLVITLGLMALMGLLTLVGGLVAFYLITRPLSQLTHSVSNFDGQSLPSVPAWPGNKSGSQEIATLNHAFRQMSQRILDQWQQLTHQDQQRRDMIANISHDLRTPMTSLHGYLETLRLKDGRLSAEERRRYLDIALGQSHKVGRLAQELFELARLESGLVEPDLAAFALSDVVQDVVQKFELSAESCGQSVIVEMSPELIPVNADLGMIERVLTNLLDNAIRHNPPGTNIVVRLSVRGQVVQVDVEDTGVGICEDLRAGLFTRASTLRHVPYGGGGLGLIIVQRLLQLHGSQVKAMPAKPRGSVFRFELSAA